MAVDWLDELEQKVQATAEALEAARAENRRLGRELDKAHAHAKTLAVGQESSESLVAERDETRRRVEKLVTGLEALLESPNNG